MGIQGLLPLLSPIHNTSNLSQLKGQTVGVDAYVWLHKGAFGCAMELAQGIPTKKYVTYCIKRVRQLREHDIWPVLVFDGANLPAKAGTEAERQRSREENRIRGLAFLKNGQKDRAFECFQGALDVTPQMAYDVIQELKKENIEFVVAPYEADAQLAYLERRGIITAVLTEDSDLLVFGCKNVFFKMDNDGNGILIRRKDFGKIKEFKSWTDTRFRQMCIMSGCDYLPSPPGVGLKKAQQYLLTSDAHRVIKSWVSWGKTVKAPKIPPGYLEAFQRAEMTFLHQRVYDADSACLVPLTPIPEGTDQGLLSCIGADIDPTLAKEIALGEVDPISKKRFEDQEFVSVKASRTPQEKPARLPPFNPRLAQPRRPLSETLEATNSTAKVLDKCEKVKNSQVKQKISASAISRTPSAFRFKSLLKTRNSVVVKKVTSSVSHYFNALTTSSTSTDTVVNADAGGQDGYALSSKKKIRLDQIFK